MPLLRIACLLLAFLLVASAPASAQVSARVEVTGAVRQSLDLDAAALAAFPAEAIGRFTQARSGAGASSQSTVRGVRLGALIERAGLAPADRNAWKTLAVIATATDGYRAVFSWPEITNTAVGEGVLVIFERDGKPLDEREGRIALISAADLKLGPRHVRNLKRIELRALD
ncbi:molybdopterin-dependent oxidoreductase [Variovorax saccharolyticus]|uniref:molybdopterin-dependent oxidoreductase n=1 Tax=Variovorax saccharolyticus TaxID=3053516 RepID=UPI00257864E2|nr:molybdopterin-dependent oxidoreductase [Variovorax sp. J22R187]MDM0018874.1 molybdopterin-dependent oxidoreductase [Variovorax sp. J22R187]